MSERASKTPLTTFVNSLKILVLVAILATVDVTLPTKLFRAVSIAVTLDGLIDLTTVFMVSVTCRNNEETIRTASEFTASLAILL